MFSLLLKDLISEFYLEHSEKYVHSLLSSAMLWSVDNKAYEPVDPNNEPTRVKRADEKKKKNQQ